MVDHGLARGEGDHILGAHRTLAAEAEIHLRVAAAEAVTGQEPDLDLAPAAFAAWTPLQPLPALLAQLVFAVFPLPV